MRSESSSREIVIAVTVAAAIASAAMDSRSTRNCDPYHQVACLARHLCSSFLKVHAAVVQGMASAFWKAW